MATDGTVPTFGLWYDIGQKPPLGAYAGFYGELGADRGEQALANVYLFPSGVAPGVRRR